MPRCVKIPPTNLGKPELVGFFYYFYQIENNANQGMICAGKSFIKFSFG